MIIVCFTLINLTVAGSSTKWKVVASQPVPQTTSRKRTSTKITPRIDYSRFSHATTQHKNQCDACHKFPSKNWQQVRAKDDAFPDISEFPDHQSCLNCHRAQFFARERPTPRICLNCHVKAIPTDTSRYPFPSLGEAFRASAKGRDFVSDFVVFFPHDKHLDVISRNLMPRSERPLAYVRASFSARPTDDSEPKNCAVCHQTYQPQGDSKQEFVTSPPKNHGDAFWLKKGTFKSLPSSHSNCFTCHNQESELAPLPQSCASCHKFASNKPPTDFDRKLANTIGIDEVVLSLWRRRSSAGAFRHETHADVNCTKCHDTAKMNTVDKTTLNIPVKSCGGAEGCHVTATTDEGGILNYEMDQRKADASFVCSKCHIVFGNQPIPAGHLAAPKSSTQ